MAGQISRTRTTRRKYGYEKERNGIEDMHPAYFAMIMATGIVSMAAHLQHMDGIGNFLFWSNAVFFLIVSALSLYRLFRFPVAMKDDLLDHRRSVGYLTTVAGICVLGCEFVKQQDMPNAAAVLLIAGLVLWPLIMYAVLSALSLAAEKPALDQGLDGSWLLTVVATESLAVLACALAPYVSAFQLPLVFGAFCFWMLGGAIYSWIVSLIIYRYTFFPMKAESISPTHWIDMGAMAIATLAGVELIRQLGDVPQIAYLQSFTAAMTCTFWAISSWWWPLAAVFGIAHVWRHGLNLRYQPALWSTVFPLGMYAVCTQMFADSMGLVPLNIVAQIMSWLSLAAWVIVFAGFCLTRFSSFMEQA